MLHVTELIGFMVGGIGPHRYWRCRSTSQQTVGGENYGFACTEMEMRLVEGDSSSDLCIGGTAIASSAQASYPPSAAYDGVTTVPAGDLSGWIANTDAIGEWIGYDFGRAVTPYQFWFYPFNILAAPMQVASIAFDYSDDTLIWNTAKEFTGLTWSLDTPKTFNIRELI